MEEKNDFRRYDYPYADGKVIFGWVCPRCGTVNAPIAYTCHGDCVSKNLKEWQERNKSTE